MQYIQLICFSIGYRCWTQFISSLQGLLLSLNIHLTYVPECVQLINHKNDDIPWSNWTLYKKHLLCFLKREGQAISQSAETAALPGGMCSEAIVWQWMGTWPSARGISLLCAGMLEMPCYFQGCGLCLRRRPAPITSKHLFHILQTFSPQHIFAQSLVLYFVALSGKGVWE